MLLYVHIPDISSKPYLTNNEKREVQNEKKLNQIISRQGENENAGKQKNQISNNGS